jgi:hypothetical protein
MSLRTTARRTTIATAVSLAAVLATGCMTAPAEATITTHPQAGNTLATIVLPLSNVTPGALNPAVTQANIQSTICKSGWTSTIRPPSSYTTNLKKTQLATTYAVFAKTWGTSTGAYEEDHLISLELGGAPSDPKNLWPEPYASATGARIKDKIETRLKKLVCAGSLPLATAQTAITTNWYTAYLQYYTN